MATVGQALTAPEATWRRYDDSDSRIAYIGTWGIATYSGNYGEAYHNGTGIGNKYKFKFKGTKFRLISFSRSFSTDNVQIKIDGQDVATVSFAVGNNFQTIVYEKLSLSFTTHTVEVTSNSTGEFLLDAIDIDDTGYLVHPTLNQVSDVNAMIEGDCIPCRYTALTSGVAGYFSELGTCITNEIPVLGTATPNGLFYLIKTAKGTLIADRVIQNSISWDVLNSAKFIEGNSSKDVNIIPPLTSDNINGYKVTYSSIYGAGWEGWRAFNRIVNNANDSWISAASSVISWLAIQLPIKTTIDSYSLTDNRGDNGAPKNWTFEGSDDGTTWVVLDTQINQNINFNNSVRIYNLSSKASYFRYRINITANNGQVYTSVGELKVNITLTDKIINIHSLSGGCAYADANGNSSLTNKSLGTWPTNNEWDKYIVNSDLKGKIIKGDDNVWHWKNHYSLTKDTLVNGVIEDLTSTTATNTHRGLRGLNSVSRFHGGVSGGVWATAGFRPVLNYVESDIASEVIY